MQGESGTLVVDSWCRIRFSPCPAPCDRRGASFRRRVIVARLLRHSPNWSYHARIGRAHAIGGLRRNLLRLVILSALARFLKASNLQLVVLQLTVTEVFEGRLKGGSILARFAVARISAPEQLAERPVRTAMQTLRGRNAHAQLLGGLLQAQALEVKEVNDDSMLRGQLI